MRSTIKEHQKYDEVARNSYRYHIKPRRQARFEQCRIQFRKPRISTPSFLSISSRCNNPWHVGGKRSNEIVDISKGRKQNDDNNNHEPKKKNTAKEKKRIEQRGWWRQRGSFDRKMISDGIGSDLTRAKGTSAIISRDEFASLGAEKMYLSACACIPPPRLAGKREQRRHPIKKRNMYFRARAMAPSLFEGLCSGMGWFQSSVASIRFPSLQFRNPFSSAVSE